MTFCLTALPCRGNNWFDPYLKEVPIVFYPNLIFGSAKVDPIVKTIFCLRFANVRRV